MAKVEQQIAQEKLEIVRQWFESMDDLTHVAIRHDFPRKLTQAALIEKDSERVAEKARVTRDIDIKRGQYSRDVHDYEMRFMKLIPIGREGTLDRRSDRMEHVRRQMKQLLASTKS